MNHSEVELLLGAFALDAIDPDEAAQVQAHLLECPRCQAEVASHREMAAMLGSSAAEPPTGLWDKIALAIEQERPPGPVLPGGGSAGPGPVPLRTRRRRLEWGATLAAAAVAIALLAAEVGHLSGQVSSLRSAVSRLGLAGAAAQVEAGPHRTIRLTSAKLGRAGAIVVAPGGSAYWTWSSLPQLPQGRTYQLWGLTRGQAVSLGLIGPDPRAYSGFRLENDVTEVMVTAEPEGGTAKPTTPVLAQGTVPVPAVG